MPSLPDVGVIVVAAGQGRRAGSGELKQLRPIAGAPMLLRALRPFLSHQSVARVVAVLPSDIVSNPPDWLAPLAGERLRLTSGGAERVDSVELGIRALDSELPIVLVHDGARPFPDPLVIDRIIAHARAGRAAIAAIPVTDTLKEAVSEEANGSAVVRRTVDRQGLWRAQTPQGFPRALLQRGLDHARANQLVATDDAAMVEPFGVKVVLVPDCATNIKVTSADDFVLAEALARRA